MAHTKGPWRVGAMGTEIRAENGRLICDIAGHTGYPETSENARVVSLVPAMINALEDLLCAATVRPDPIIHPSIEQAQLVLKKIRGEA